MYTVTTVRPEEGFWWIVFISWDDVSKTIYHDEAIAEIIEVSKPEMKTELIRYYGAELDETDGLYWKENFEAKKAIENYFEPKLMALKMARRQQEE